MSNRPSAILTFHSLDESQSVISFPPALFRRQLQSLRESGIPVVPLDRILSEPGSVSITFDDGFVNLLEHAVPALVELQMPASVFVVSAYCGARNNWPTQPAGRVPDLPLMDWSQLRDLPQSIEIGAHSRTHPDLRTLPLQKSEQEMVQCRDEVQQRLGRAVTSIAYPYGASSPEIRSIARTHFRLAVGTELTYLSRDSDPFDLPRLDAYYLRSRPSLEGLFKPSTRAYVAFRNALRSSRLAVSGSHS